MSEVVVVGSFKIKPGKEEEALEAFKALVEPTHREEGCILYALHRGVDDPGRLTFIERWESRELLDAHLRSDHVSALLQRATSCGETRARSRCTRPSPRGSRRRARSPSTRAPEPPGA